MYIGKRVTLGKNVRIGYGTKLYGFSEIGDGTLIDSYVIIGYPIRRKVMESIAGAVGLDELFDSISDGVRIGRQCIVRSGTVIYERVVLEDGVETGHSVLIREDTVIGSNTKIGTATIIDGKVVIGSNTSIQSGVYIPPGVKIGSNVFIGPRAVFTNDRYPPSRRLAEIVVEDDVVIGASSVIVAGIRIGRGAVIAAGSVVTRSVDPYTVVMGVPAKPIMKRDEYDKRRVEYEEKYLFPYR